MTNETLTNAEQAREAFIRLGHDALNNPHGLTGKSCGCGTCFCCEAFELLKVTGHAHLPCPADHSYDVEVAPMKSINVVAFNRASAARKARIAGFTVRSVNLVG